MWTMAGWLGWSLVVGLAILAFSMVVSLKGERDFSYWGLVAVGSYWGLIAFIFIFIDWNKLHIFWLFPIPIILLLAYVARDFVAVAFAAALGILICIMGLGFVLTLILPNEAEFEARQKAREKAEAEELKRVTDSLDREVRALLINPQPCNAGLSTVVMAEPYLGWYVGDDPENFVNSDQNGIIKSYRLPNVATSLIDVDSKAKTFKPREVPTLVLVKGSLYERKNYRITQRITTSKYGTMPPFTTREPGFDQPYTASTYTLSVSVIDRKLSPKYLMNNGVEYPTGSNHWYLNNKHHSRCQMAVAEPRYLIGN